MDLLKKLNFTEYQTKIIKSLMYLNKATAMQISRHSKVPANKVYQTIKDLNKIGIIMETHTNTKEYSLINFDVYLKNRIKEEQKNVYKLEDEYSSFIQSYQKPVQSEDFWILNDLDSLLKKVEETYENLEDESCGIIEVWASRYSTLKQVNKITKEGKSVKFLGKVTKEVIPHVKRWLDVGVEIRHLDRIDKAGFSIFDNKYLKISIDGSQSLKSIWSENVDLAKILKNYFEILWDKGTPVTFDNLSDFE